MKRLCFLVAIPVLGLCFSCEKDKDILKGDAILTWGNPALDGCGFFIEINGKEYKPTNVYIIDKSYEEDGEKMRVKIKYKLLNEKIRYSCGPAVDAIGDGIELISIKKK